MKSLVLNFLTLVFMAVLSANVSAQIQISSAFQMNTALPIDTRAVATDLTARDAISALRRYEGLVVYVVSEGTNYQLVGGTDNANWVEFSGSGGGLAKWTTGTLYEVDAVVWLEDDDKIYVCIEEHTAGASFDPTKWQELSSAEDKLDKFPSETNDNRLVRTDVDGNAVQGSLAALDDAGALSGLTQLDVDNVRIDGSSITTTATDEDLTIDPDGSGRVVIPSVGANHVVYTGANSRLKGENQFSYNDSTNTLRVDGVGIGGSSTITTHSGNQDLTLSAHGSGEIIANKPTNIEETRIEDNRISATTTNDDLVLAGDGTGRVKIERDAVEYEAGSNNPELGELMLYPSFEEGEEGVETTATATLIPSDFHGKQALSIAFNAGGGTYYVDKNLPTDGSRDNVTHKVSCAISATAAGGRFLLRSNGATVAEVDVDNITGEPQQYTMLTSGTTSIGWGVSHDDETLIVDKCSITNDFTSSPGKSCNGDLGCENAFVGEYDSAESTLTEAVKSQTPSQWITNTTKSGANARDKAFTVSAGIFSVVPNCVTGVTQGGVEANYRKGSSTPTSLAFRTLSSQDGSNLDGDFNFVCYKSPEDYVKTDESGVIVTGSSAGAVLVVTNEGSVANTNVGVGTVTAPFDTIKRSEGFSWSTASNEATVLKSGRYSLSPEITIWNNDTSGATTSIYFELDRGSGYTSLPGDDSECQVYSVNTNAAGGNPNCRFIADLRAGDKLRVRVTGTHASTFIRNNTTYSRMTIEPVLNNETVAALLSTQYVSGGVEVDTGDKWDGAAIYRRCYEVASDITTSTTIDTLPSGLGIINALNHTGNSWRIYSYTEGGTSTNLALIAYNSSNGSLVVSIGGSFKVGAGTRFCMEYTKP